MYWLGYSHVELGRKRRKKKDVLLSSSSMTTQSPPTGFHLSSKPIKGLPRESGDGQ